MEIIKSFTDNNFQSNITIKGSIENPLFRTSDIADILDMKNIRVNIQNFDSDLKSFPF